MKLDDFEEGIRSFLRFLEGEKNQAKKTVRLQRPEISKSECRNLEEWAYKHTDFEIRALCRRAFDLHDQDAMDQLRIDYAWFLQRNE